MYLLEKDLNNVLVTFLKRLQKLKQEAVENETGMAEKFRWDQANRRQKPGLVWRNGKKISHIIKDYFYLPFFLLIILRMVLSANKLLSYPLAHWLERPLKGRDQ